MNHHLLLYGNFLKLDQYKMNQAPSTTAGMIPLQEYRREIPPGWQPGDPAYPLKAYFDRLRLWYRIASLDDELIGPTIAGRLYGRAHRVAMSLRVPRPDGTFDLGDAALVRLEVDEVRDPSSGILLQAHIPSGVQFLTSALRAAFGQQDQDLATQSLERFFSLQRGRLSLQEYSVEYDARFDEASDRAGLQMNEVARFFLFFRGSGLSMKQIDDLKLQVQGDYTRFAEARALALRLASNKTEESNDNYYAQDGGYDEDTNDYHNNSWYQDDGYDDSYWWYDQDEVGEGEWVLEYEEDPEEMYWQQSWDDDYGHYYDEAYDNEKNDSVPVSGENNTDETKIEKEEYYGGKGQTNDGCFNCGSKWHRVKDCPMAPQQKGQHHQSHGGKGKGYAGHSKGKGKGKVWRWRPFGKGKGKTKGKYGKYGKGKGKGKSKKGYGGSSWYASRTNRGLNIADGIPDGSTRKAEAMKQNIQEYQIHTPPDETQVTFQKSSSSSTENVAEAANEKLEKKHLAAFNFAFNFYEAADYFMVKGEKRRGLVIDPGAASGLIGSETLRDLIDHCVAPFGKEKDVVINKDVRSPVSGISGGSDQTLGQVTVPLCTGGCPISYTGEVIGGDGSLCPPLIGNPSLRKMHCSIFTEHFVNGDGLLVLNSMQDTDQPLKMMRLLLTDSGHYILPTDHQQAGRVSAETQKEVAIFCSRVATTSSTLWDDVDPRVYHVFTMNKKKKTVSYAEGDRSENDPYETTEHMVNLEDNDKVKKNIVLHYDNKTELDEKDEKEDGAISILLKKGSDEARDEPHDKHNDRQDLRDQPFDEQPCGEQEQHADQPTQLQHHTNSLHPRQQQNDPQNNHNSKENLIHHNSETEFPGYTEDVFPEESDQSALRKKYKSMPEEYYTRSGLRPITPWNFKSWFQQARGKKLRWHFWELFSGSGRLSLVMLLAGLTVGFPVDMRYGWNLNNQQHQGMLRQARDEFCPGVMFMAPECGPWSVSSSAKAPELREAERRRDQLSIDFVQENCEKQSKHGRGYIVEQPWGSAMWRPEDGSPLHLETIQDNRTKQRVDQCMVGAQAEDGSPIQKATGLGSNIKFKKTAIRCSGHKGKQHLHLRGQAPDGINRTAKAAVYPRLMCQKIKADVTDFLNNRNLLQIPQWPQSLSWFVSEHFYECIRCTLGRSCPKGIEHSLIPGKCRHGRWAPGTNPKQKASTEPDPIKLWKNEARKSVLDQVNILDESAVLKLDIEFGHYMKKILIELVNSTIGLFSEASHRKVEYVHWVDNATAMSIVKEIFKSVMLVKGIKISLRPFNKSGPEPTLPTSSAYLRCHVWGHVKLWHVEAVEDMREMSIAQINEAYDIDDWLFTIYGTDAEATPAPSTPSSRPRAIPKQPGLPPRGDDAALLPQVHDRPDNPDEELEEAKYEDETFESQDRSAIAPIKPNYNMKRVLERLPKLVEEGDRTRALKLLVGLHERLWHTPVMDFMNLLRRAGMPVEVVNLASEAVQGCVVCRKFVRLPNRPQLRAGGSTYFGETVQLDIFHWEGNNFLLIIDEATRYKTCVLAESQESEWLMALLFKSWIQYFGPPSRVVLDQQSSLMGYETGGEFERLNIARCPRGTTQGHGANQHTGTGIVERHIQLTKLTMWKLRAELERQGLSPDPAELCQEAAMAHNQTLNYGGVTPCMSVFGVLPRGFYNPENPGVMSVVGSLQTDVTVFERAMRIRQTALATTHQSIIEDRVARANRTRPHQANVGEMVAGTSEVEFFREVQGDPGWRGPALLLRLDQDEGVAVIQYQGKPYLVSLRHIRPYRGIYLVEVANKNVEQSLFQLMKFVESLSDYKINIFGWLRRKRDGRWYKTPRETPGVQNVMQWADEVSKSMTRTTLHGIMVGKSIRTFKPPTGTTGTLITWLIGGKNYAVQEHKSANHMKMKKISNHAKEDTCIIYFYYYQVEYGEPEATTKKTEVKKMDAMDLDIVENMDVDKEDKKRLGPETRTVVIGQERKKQKVMMMQLDVEFLKHYYTDNTRKQIILLDYPEQWKTGYDIVINETRNYLIKQYDMKRRALPILFQMKYKTSHRAEACLRSGQIYKVDQETNNIDEDQISADIWQEVDAADLAEVRQFVEEKAFRKIHTSAITADMVVVDARWVRKKKRYPDKSIRIKSRLCARGFLDQQKDLLTTRSTTATRLSQRIIISQAARRRERQLESIDVAGAFLKGFDFKQIQKALKELGIQAPSRTVIILPPLNVFKHLAALSDEFKIPMHQISEYGLLCNKPVYGLNDAPLAWQLCLHSFLKETGGSPSRLDENFFTWKEKDKVIALATTHVDDIALTADLPWLDNMNKMFTKRFGKVTRQQLPFDHCGCHYEKTNDGYKISQEDFAKKMESVEVPEREDESKLSAVEVTSLRSALGGLLWLTATRLDIVADVSILQSRVTVSQIKDLKHANQILLKVKEFATVGLHYRIMEAEKVRLVCIHDASSASQGRHYAQEGLLICLAEDKFAGEAMDYETVFEEGDHHGGVGQHGGFMHVLFASGSKAKRVSYSTSHAETLSMVGGMEASTLIMVRLAEIMHEDKAPTLAQLTKIQEEGVRQLPVDYGDCRDVFELLTGQRTLPQDKSQRLYILSLKEARLVGKMRLLTLVPTQCMTSDALTKPLVHESLLLLLTTGIVRFFNVEGHPVVSRLLPTLGDYDEHDIIKNDEEIKEMVYEKKKKPTMSHAMALLGLMGSFDKTAPRMMMAFALFGAATADEEMRGMVMAPQQQEGGVPNYIGVYFLIFLTVIAAINVEKLGKYFVRYIMQKSKVTTTNKMKVKTEDDEDGPTPMDVDETFMHGFDRAMSGDRPMEMRAAKRKLQVLEEDKQELEATIVIKEDAIDSLQKQLTEKKREAVEWEQVSKSLEQRLERMKGEKAGLADKEERRQDEIEELNEKIGKMYVENESLEKKLQAAKEEKQKGFDLLTAANRQVLTLKDRLAEKEKLLQERIPMFGQPRQEGVPPQAGGLFQAAGAASDQEARLRADVERQAREIADKARQVESLRQDRAQLGEQLAQAKAPSEIFYTRYGTCYHKADCNHLKHGPADRPRSKLSRCRDCLE